MRRATTALLTSERVKAFARDAGFDLCGITHAGPHERLRRLASWLASGHAGDMHYLHASAHERVEPALVLPTVRSVVSLGVVYNTAHPLSAGTVGGGRVAIARYAWGTDYHDVIRDRLRMLVRAMADAAGAGLEAVSFVDNGPVQERVFAEQAGLGWIGKNTCLINPHVGSWVFLAEVLTNAELEADSPAHDQCGTCTRCLDACPTGAIVEPYTVDATRCLSYLTIEIRGDVEEALRPAIRDQIFGCDICQDVCPWNRRAAVSIDAAWQPREGLGHPELMSLCAWSDEEWRDKLKGSAMRRAGLHRIRRTLAYAAVSLPDPDALSALETLASHPSGGDAAVRDAIVWAVTRVRARSCAQASQT